MLLAIHKYTNKNIYTIDSLFLQSVGVVLDIVQ